MLIKILAISYNGFLVGLHSPKKSIVPCFFVCNFLIIFFMMRVFAQRFSDLRSLVWN